MGSVFSQNDLLIDATCYMTLCPNIGLFRSHFDLAETENPPAWARDARGTPMEGWSCSGFGDRDTGYMQVVGSTMLHELFHCWTIFQEIPEDVWDATIFSGLHWAKDTPWHKIIDNPGGVLGCMSAPKDYVNVTRLLLLRVTSFSP